MAQITKSNIAQIRADVEAALRAVYAKHGIDVTVGRITYNSESFRCRIEGNVRGATGAGNAAPTNAYAAALKNKAYMLGKTFDATKIYRVGTLGRAQVVGYNGRARKYPFIVKQLSTGKQFVVSAMTTRNAVEAGEVA